MGSATVGDYGIASTSMVLTMQQQHCVYSKVRALSAVQLPFATRLSFSQLLRSRRYSSELTLSFNIAIHKCSLAFLLTQGAYCSIAST